MLPLMWLDRAYLIRATDLEGSDGPDLAGFPTFTRWHRGASPLLEDWMTKADLVEQVAEAIGPGITKKDCALVVDGFLNAVKRALAEGENIEIRGFGTFKVRSRKSRMARNPRTGDPVEVPSRSVPVFKPSKHLRARVAGLDRVLPY